MEWVKCFAVVSELRKRGANAPRVAVPARKRATTNKPRIHLRTLDFAGLMRNPGRVVEGQGGAMTPVLFY
jgi:hypothetical protein